jgi:DNA polymerase-3 subunit alpha
MPEAKAGQPAKFIRYGLGAVKGSGQSAIEAIIAARTLGGPFVSLFDFAKRVDKRYLNRRTIESLVRAGAFDCLQVNRAILLASVSLAMGGAEQAQASIHQVSLFGGDDSDLEPAPEYVKAEPWGEKQKLTEEKLALGFYLSGHLFDIYSAEVRQFARAKLAGLEPAREPRLLVGVIAGIRSQMTQRGRILIVTLDDNTATVDVTIYSELVEANKALFKEDEFLAVQGKVSEDRFSGGLRVTAEKVMDLGAARIQYGRELYCHLSASADTVMIKKLLTPYRAEQGMPVTMRYSGQGASGELRLGQEWRVTPADALTQDLRTRFGVQNVGIEY